jgi:hypothetical protein
LAASLALIVRLSAAPAVGVVVAALRTKWSAAPEATIAVRVELVAVQVRQTAVTVY